MVLNQEAKMEKIDTKINAALLFTIFIQATAAFFWIGSAAQRLDGLEVRFNQQAPFSERLARLETELAAVRISLHRIENRLDNQGQKL